MNVGGGIILAQLKKILISLPDKMLEEIDSIITLEKINRSEFVRNAMKLYIREKKRVGLREKLIKGYQEMDKVNLLIANKYFLADCEEQQKYEDKLKELEPRCK